MIEQAGVLAYRILAVAKIDPSEIGYNEYIENDDAAIVSILNQVYIVAGMVAVITIVIAGLVYAYRVATWWGAAGVTLAVLYMLKGYTSLLTIAIGLIVIGAVVYVIIKSDKKHTPPPIS